MLRVSAEISGETVGVQAVTAGNEAPGSGVAHGDLLVAFTEAAVGPDAANTPEAGPLRRLLSRALQPAVGPLVRIVMSLRR